MCDYIHTHKPMPQTKNSQRALNLGAYSKRRAKSQDNEPSPRHPSGKHLTVQEASTNPLRPLDSSK
ncbi:hypothetical protein FRC10_011334 [Ceratobasidium sp. 414]|nr:hypothetical protein FRC10_011334 [Ceratobasidium sp. 414]